MQPAMLVQRVAPTCPQRTEGIPRVFAIGMWLFLVLMFAGPMVLVVALPVASGLWRFETSRGNRFALWPWLRHLCEMTVAMYAGMLVYMAVAGPMLISLFGDGVPSGAIRYCGMVLAMVLPMVALMRAEGHSWQMAQEMTLAMVAPIVLCFGLLGLAVCPLVPFLGWLTPTSVYAAAHDGMLLGMVALMVVRRGTYVETGPMTPHVAVRGCMEAR
jgi:hypothetical protein